jgi:hypothetical protein
MHPFDMFDIDVKRRSYKTGGETKEDHCALQKSRHQPRRFISLKKTTFPVQFLHAPVSPVFLLSVLLPIV